MNKSFYYGTFLCTALLAVLVFFAPNPIDAQTVIDSTISANSIGIAVTPQNPRPGDAVTITLDSFSADLASSTITWKSNGRTLLNGSGETSYSFTLGEAGDAYLISISITTSSGQVIERSVLIQPSDIDLLWEATNSYTPPFYRGKALPSVESTIKITALPATSNQSIIYTWRRNDKAVQGASGFGKKSYSFNMNYLNAEEIVEVEARSQDGSYKSGGSLVLTPSRPEIVIYQDSPRYGTLYNRAVNESFRFMEGNTALVAKPFFFSIGDNTSLVSYEWFLGSDQADSSTDKLTLTKERGSSGLVPLRINVQKQGSLFELAEQSPRINF